MHSVLLIGLMISMVVVGGCGRNESVIILSNAELKQEIEAAINFDAELSVANLSVSTDSKRNVAQISGSVESEALHKRALDLIRNAHAELTIVDDIVIKPKELKRAEYTSEQARQERAKAKERKERIGNSTDDAWIHAALLAKLARNADTSDNEINVDVNNNVVTLRGTVYSSFQRSTAVRLAKETEGVKRVNNLLKLERSGDSVGS